MATIVKGHEHKVAKGHNLWLFCYDREPEAPDVPGQKKRKKNTAQADEMVAMLVFNPTGMTDDLKVDGFTIPGRNDWDIVWGDADLYT